MQSTRSNDSAAAIWASQTAREGMPNFPMISMDLRALEDSFVPGETKNEIRMRQMCLSAINAYEMRKESIEAHEAALCGFNPHTSFRFYASEEYRVQCLADGPHALCKKLPGPKHYTGIGPCACNCCRAESIVNDLLEEMRDLAKTGGDFDVRYTSKSLHLPHATIEPGRLSRHRIQNRKVSGSR